MGARKQNQDLVGQRFGKLTVIEKTVKDEHFHTRWVCRCDCGNIKLVKTGDLNGGKVKSCGCILKQTNNRVYKFKDMTGLKIGRWTVISLVGNSENKSRSYVWLCRCDCGTEKILDGADLRKGNSHSCGCLQREQLSEKRRNSHGVTTLNGVFGVYRYNAIKRGYEFELTKEQFKEITQQNCFYCGSEPSNIQTNYQNEELGNYIYNGLDRVDNDKGYTLDNVVPCCKICNRIKLDHNLDFLIDHMKKIISIYEDKIAKDS